MTALAKISFYSCKLQHEQYSFTKLKVSFIVAEQELGN
jgi:hypothetical protein